MNYPLDILMLPIQLIVAWFTVLLYGNCRFWNMA